MNKILACIFDLDGVIVDSNSIHTVAWDEYLQRFDIRIQDVEARMRGKHNTEIVRDFFGGGLSAEEVASHGAPEMTLQPAAFRRCLANLVSSAARLHRPLRSPAIATIAGSP